MVSKLRIYIPPSCRKSAKRIASAPFKEVGILTERGIQETIPFVQGITHEIGGLEEPITKSPRLGGDHYSDLMITHQMPSFM